MKDQKLSLHDRVAAYLNECKKNIDSEIYYKAIGEIKNAKSADPRNIYIIALEKQVSLLSELSKKRQTGSAPKNEIRATIPELIRRAVEDSRNRNEASKSKSGKENGSDNNDDSYIRERELALKKLKNQLIKHAEEFIDEGDYQSALDEIRRIFIVDPGNTAAKELENQVEAFINARSEEPSPDTIKTKKRRSLRFGRATTLVIALLVAANVTIYIITSMTSGSNPYTREISDTNRNNSSQARYTGQLYDGRSESLQSGSIQYINSLPDNLFEYRNAIAIKNEVVERVDYTEKITTEPAETTNADISVQVGLIEEYESNNTNPVPENNRRESAQVFVSKPETILRLERPLYPAEASEQGIEGDVIIRVLYDTAGTVNVSFVESSDHPLLSASALQSARMSRFIPSGPDDRESTQWVTIPYQFRLGE